MADPTTKNIGTAEAPLTIPVGSAADLAQSGKTYEEQVASPTVQTQIKEQNLTPISPSAAPTPTGSFTPPSQTAPDVTGNYITSLSQDLDAKRKALEQRYKTELETIQSQKKQSEDRIAELETKQEDTLTQNVQPLTQPFREDLETRERDRLKVEENYFANQGLVNELNTLLTQGNEAIRRMRPSTQGIPDIFAQGNLQTVMSDVAARAGVIEAVMAARNNQIAQAYNLIDRSVKATTADRQDQLTYYNALLEFYATQKDDEGKKLIDLTKDERTFLDKQVALLETDLQSAQKTADYLKELMIDPETAKFVADAGITLNDNIQTINKKMAEQTKRIERQEQQKTNRKEASDAGITTQFYNKGGLIVRTSDGFEFETPEQFQQMTGMTVQDAQRRNLITNYVSPAALDSSIQKIGGRVVRFVFDSKGKVVSQTDLGPDTGGTTFAVIGTDDNGNNRYGFVNTDTQTITPLSGSSISIPQNTLAFRNNNPGNLRYVGQAGASSGEGGFARFSSPEEGYQALVNQIQLDSNRGLTLSQFINKYAPPTENNTSLYIQQATAATGADQNTPIANIDLATLAQFIAKKESGTTIAAPSTANLKIDTYTNDVIDGKITLSSVPDKLQDAVSRRIPEIQTQRQQTKYSSEFEARVDYNNDINQLLTAKQGGKLQGSPSDIIKDLVLAYGKYVSEQEIQSTIYNLLGVPQPQTSTKPTSTNPKPTNRSPLEYQPDKTIKFRF